MKLILMVAGLAATIAVSAGSSVNAATLSADLKALKTANALVHKTHGYDEDDWRWRRPWHYRRLHDHRPWWSWRWRHRWHDRDDDWRHGRRDGRDHRDWSDRGDRRWR